MLTMIERLKNSHNSAADFHSKEYKEKLNKILYGDICATLFENISGCYSVSEGILKKGLCTSLVKYYNGLDQVFAESTNDTKQSIL